MALWTLLCEGGFVMLPLGLCSLVVWCIIVERSFFYTRIAFRQESFFLEASNHLLYADREGVKRLCEKYTYVPGAQVLLSVLSRFESPHELRKKHWREAMERRTIQMQSELKRALWVLGTIASASPFIGLFGTVVGILRSFQSMAASGNAGFTVVGQGISESLIATAAGIIVAVIAVVAFNTLQVIATRLGQTLRLQMDELMELLV